MAKKSVLQKIRDEIAQYGQYSPSLDNMWSELDSWEEQKEILGGYSLNKLSDKQVLANLDRMLSTTEESYANEDLDLEKKDCQLCNFTVVWKKGDDWQKEDAEREFKEHQNNKHGIFESYATESEFACPYCKSDDISTDKHDYFKCNNCNRPFDIPYEEPEYDPYTESYATENIEDIMKKYNMKGSVRKNYSGFGEWTHIITPEALGGIDIQSFVNDDAFIDARYFGQDGTFGVVYDGESYASEDSLVKIEDDDDKDTKVTVLDEWENETDPDVGGDVEGLDQDQKDSRESWSRKSFNQKVEALEAVGFRQGKALRFASLAFEDFSKELQEAIDSVTQEDAEDEQEFIEQTRKNEKEAGLVEVDYNNIGESRTARSKYECEFCNCGFKSNESLTVHYNDLHAVPPTQIDGYENWKEVADDLYKKELAKLKKRGRESVAGEKERAEWSWLVDKDTKVTVLYEWENESTESLSDDNKDVLRNWVKQNPYWTSIDDLPNEIFVSLMQKFGDDTDKRVEAQSEIINFMKSVSNESYANEDDYKYDFEDLTSLAQDKIESSGVTQSEWDNTPKEERKELEEEIIDGEAYNPSDLVCPECGDITKDDKEFEDHLSAHRFDDGGY
jgi:ribosomal protein L37AE/L43A